MFGFVEEEDLDFNPVAGSKLASLFSLERSPEEGNASLTYTAPKQPKYQSNEDGIPSKKPALKGSSSTSVPTGKLSLIAVKAVTSFKLEDGNYNPQGKLGLAVLGNSSSRLYQLLLYKGKQQQIATVRITPHFQFTVQPHLYATFYDDRTQNWSIMFENKDDAVELSTHVAVARYRSASPVEESIINQELLPGTGDCFKEGETVELKLAAQPFPMDSVQAVDVKKYVIEVSLSYKLISSGWAAGLVGAAPGSLRAILVPLNTQVPWLTSKRNEPLLIQASIDGHKESDVNPPKESPQKKSKSSAPASGVDSAVDSSSTEDSSVRARGASIKEALTSSPRSNKASIISRMARMGQATLPLKGAIACNPSDSEETEEDSRAHAAVKPVLKARPTKTRSSSSALRQQVVASTPQSLPVSSNITTAAVSVVQTPTHWNQQQSIMRPGADGSVVQIMSSDGQLLSLSSQQQLPLLSSNAMMSPNESSPHMSMLLSEARMQNTEMRMYLSKFSDRMDQLMTKVDSLQLSAVPAASMGTPGVSLEPNILLSSIEKLVRDNQSLQTELSEKNKRLEEQNERIFSLLNTNSKFLEQSSSLLEQKKLQEQNQQKQELQQKQQEQQLLLIQKTQEEKASLGNQLTSLQNQLAAVQELVQALQKNNSELNQELEATRNRLQEKEKCLWETESSKHTSQTENELIQLNQELEIKKSENLHLQEQIKDERITFNLEKLALNDRFGTLEQSKKAEITGLKEEFSKQVDHYASVLSTLEGKCELLNQRLKEQTNQTELKPAPFSDQLIMDVKDLMNTLHKGLNQQFAPGQSYEGAQIRSTISSMLKREALQFVGNLERQLSQPSVNADEEKLSYKHKLLSSKPIVNTVEVLTESNQSVEGTAVNSSSASSQITTEKSSDVQENSAPINISERAQSPTDAKKNHDSTFETSWRPLPPPPPLFHDDDDSDDWLT